jgi:superfamily I DNA and/or RNA helicase
VNVVGRQISDVVNINEAEAKKAIEIATQVARQYPDVSIGIVTPFKHQAERINQLIPNNLLQRIDANTVHKYQGDEKDIMIYSLVVTDNSPDRKIGWIDNTVPNLVNVAVTRAKSTLYVVCNVNYIKAHSTNYKPLGYLVRNN